MFYWSISTHWINAFTMKFICFLTYFLETLIWIVYLICSSSFSSSSLSNYLSRIQWRRQLTSFEINIIHFQISENRLLLSISVSPFCPLPSFQFPFEYYVQMPAKHFYLIFAFRTPVDGNCRFLPIYWFNDKVFMINYDNALKICIKPYFFCPGVRAHGWDAHHAFICYAPSLTIDCWMKMIAYVQFQNETWPDDTYVRGSRWWCPMQLLCFGPNHRLCVKRQRWQRTLTMKTMRRSHIEWTI